MNKLVNDFALAGSGLVVFGASTGTELAREDVKWDRHGAFTKALIEAIGEGKASTDATGRITTTMLDLYLEERVKELTNGAQHPVMNRPDLVTGFPARARAAMKGSGDAWACRACIGRRECGLAERTMKVVAVLGGLLFLLCVCVGASESRLA